MLLSKKIIYTIHEQLTQFDFEIHFYSSSAGATRSLSGTIDRISGLSVIAGVSISSAKDIYFGDKVSITWTPPAAACAAAR